MKGWEREVRKVVREGGVGKMRRGDVIMGARVAGGGDKAGLGREGDGGRREEHIWWVWWRRSSMRERREGPGAPDMMRAMSRVWIGGVSGHGSERESESPSPSNPRPSRPPSFSNTSHFLFRPGPPVLLVFRSNSTLSNVNWNTALSTLASPYNLRQHTGTSL